MAFQLLVFTKDLRSLSISWRLSRLSICVTSFWKVGVIEVVDHSMMRLHCGEVRLRCLSGKSRLLDEFAQKAMPADLIHLAGRKTRNAIAEKVLMWNLLHLCQ